MEKYYALYVEIYISGVAPCVNPSKKSYSALVQRTFDEVGLHADKKFILMVMLIIT